MLEKELDVELKNEDVLNINNEEEVLVESTEETLAEEIEVVETEKESTFVKEVLAGVVDQAVAIISAIAILIVFNLILKLFGFYVAEKEPMFLIMYALVNVIYAPVCRKFKFKSTVGKKILLNK